MLDNVKKTMLSFVRDLDDKEILEVFNLIPIGKMLRSKLILKISNNSQEAIKLSAIVELIHLASLLHDDVIDEADLRRGKDTINRKFGDKSAIMLGDILYSKAFFELTSLNEKVSKTISNAVTLLSIGEYLDVNLSKEFNENREIYFDMIYKKTASLIEASSKASSILAEKDADSFALYGKNLGVAFQIIDDVLDITQDSQKLGKPAMSDFKEGKTTLPYIVMYEKLNEESKTKLKSLFKKDLDSSEIAWIKENFTKTDAVNESIDYAKKLAFEAMEAVKDEPELISIMKEMIDREF